MTWTEFVKLVAVLVPLAVALLEHDARKQAEADTIEVARTLAAAIEATAEGADR